MRLQTGIEDVLNIQVNPETSVRKEINLEKLAEVCSITEARVTDLIFCIVKQIGVIAKKGNHVALDIKLPTE